MATEVWPCLSVLLIFSRDLERRVRFCRALLCLHCAECSILDSFAVVGTNWSSSTILTACISAIYVDAI
jgi:hypothetical protein